MYSQVKPSSEPRVFYLLHCVESSLTDRKPVGSENEVKPIHSI